MTALRDTVSRCETDHAQIRGELSAGVAEILAGRPGSDRIRDAVSRLLALPDWADGQRRPSWMVLGPLFLRESETGSATSAWSGCWRGAITRDPRYQWSRCSPPPLAGRQGAENAAYSLRPGLMEESRSQLAGQDREG